MGPSFESDSNKRRRAKMRSLFKLFDGQLLKSRLGPLARYCTHQKTTSGTPEQKDLPSDQDWNGLERGHYSSGTRINAEGGKVWPLFDLSPDHY